MIARVVLLAVLAFLLFVAVRALASGKIEYGSGRDHILGDRSASPGTYWTLLGLVTALALGFGWLLFG